MCIEKLSRYWVVGWLASVVTLVFFVMPSGWALDSETALQQIPFDEVGDYLVVDPNLLAHREELLGSIRQTRDYLKTEAARVKLQAFGNGGISAEILDHSLARFADLLRTSTTQQQLVQSIRTSFEN